MTKCKDDQILNPKTLRCVKKDGKLGREILKNMKDMKDKKNSSSNKSQKSQKSNVKKSKCNDDQILNPKTLRCVKKDGKIGREILKNMVSKKSKTSSRKSKASTKKSKTPPKKSKTTIKCEFGKILNPKTGKCVKQNSKVGQYILKNLLSSIKRPKNLGKIENWTYINIPKGTLLYKGSKDKQILRNFPSYFGPDINSANFYLPKKEKGYLNIYETTKDIKLFKFDDLENANKLLKKTFSDKTPLFKAEYEGAIEQTLYDIILEMYNQRAYLRKKDETPRKMKKLYRKSIFMYDGIFSRWLCNNGFNGYHADLMDEGALMGKKYFHPEILLCFSKEDVKLVKSFHISKQKSQKDLDKLLKEI